MNGQTEKAESRHHLNSIRAQLQRWQLRFPVAHAQVSACWVSLVDNSSKPITKAEAPCGPGESPWNWIEDRIQGMAHGMRIEFSPVDRMLRDADPVTLAEARRYEERLERKEQRRAEEEQRRRETMERLAAERRQRELSAVEANKVANATKVAAKPHLKSGISNLKSGIAGRAPLPPVPLRLEMPELAFQETNIPLTDLRGWRLAEQAARWWVSNQSNDLLALPYCRIQKLDYQVRSALRIFGPLRGRALLSDEVGLGKTIEAGLVLGERFSSDEFAEEVLRRWRDSESRVAEALTSLGDELAAARAGYQQVKALDETLFAKDYETL